MIRRVRFSGRLRDACARISTEGRTTERAAFITGANVDDDADDGATPGRDDSTGETDANALGDFIVAEKTTDATHATGADDGIRTQGCHHRSCA